MAITLRNLSAITLTSLRLKNNQLSFGRARMGTSMPSRSLRSLIDRALFFILGIFTAVLFAAVIWYLKPFYGGILDNTIFQAIGQAVSGFNRIMFQFSLTLYIWYVFASIVLAVALFLTILCALYLGFLFSSRLRKKRIISKLYSCLEHVFALNIVQRLYMPIRGAVRETSKRLTKIYDSEETNEVRAGSRDWKTCAWHVSLIVFVALTVLTYRYAVIPVPQGWDTEWYIYMVRSLQTNPTLFTRVYVGRVFTLAVMYALTSLSGLMAEQVMMLLTPIIGIIYMVGVYLLVVSGTKNRLVALLGAMYTPLAFITVRLSLDLYSNYLALAFSMYAFTLFIKTMETEETRIRYTVATMIVLALILLTHVYTFLVLTGIILLYNLLELLSKGKYRRTIKRSLIIYAPFAIAVVFQPTSVLYGLGLLEVFSSSDPWKNASSENPYLLLLALAGIIAIMRSRGNTYKKTMVAWTVLTSTTLITGVFPESFRIMIFIPIGILAAHGTQAISKAIMQFHNSKLARKPILPFVFLLCFTAIVPYAYVPGNVLKPSNEAMQQYYWIEQHYGFRNSSVIVCVDKWPPSASGVDYSNYYGWGLATIGNVLYDGLLLYMLQGIPDSNGTKYLSPADRTIIIPDRFYRMTSIEYGASQRISDLGVYEVKSKTIVQIDKIIRNESLWQEDSFQLEQWVPTPPWVTLDYNYHLTNQTGVMNISVTPIHPDRWFGVETRLPTTIHPSGQLIIKAKGSTSSLLFEVEVYSDSGLITFAAFSKYITRDNYTYLQMDLSPDMAISSIRLSFYSGPVVNVTSYVQIQYMALI
jgi:hypothetical protein